MTKRRGSGDGSIFKDGDRWVACVDLAGAGRRRVRRKRTARTYAEARSKLRELQEELRAGIDPGRLNLGSYLQRWLERQDSSDKSPSTVENYRWAIDKHLSPAIGAVPLAKLTPEDVEGVLLAMARAGAARNTMMRVRAVLSMALDDAVRRRVIAWNPTTATKVPAGPRKARRSLTLEQAVTLLDAIQGDRLAAAWLILLLLGLRPGELCGLTWDDVDLDAGLLHVRRARLHEPAGMRLGPTKTSRSVRTLDMPSLVVAGLRTHRARQAAEREAAGPAWQDHNLVFTTTVGTPIDRWSLRRRFTALTEAADLGQWHPTEMRHSAVSLLSDAGVREEDVADIVGHATTRMTHEVYRHPVRPSISAAKGAMEALFGSPSA
ncbi:MAG: site-specific integrase [Acidimicrobiales bacterium]